MSHNKIKIGSSTPDASGNLTLNLSDLNDVNGTPATNQYLQYNGSNWVPASSAAGSEIGYIFIGQGESNIYSNSPHGTGAFTGNDDLYVYDTNPKNTINGSTITSSSGWISSITLPTGNYLVTGQTLLEFSSSGYAAYGFYDSSNNRLTQLGIIGTNRSAYFGAGDLAHSIIELTSTTTIKLKLDSISGALETGANQGNTPSQYGLIIIEKLV